MSALLFLVSIIDNELSQVYGQGSNITNSTTDKSGEWLNYVHSNNRFSLQYPADWKVETKLSKFHVLDFKLLKNNPFSFIGIEYSGIANPDKLSNKILLDQSEKFGKLPTQSGYSVYDVLERSFSAYKIDGHQGASHVVKYVYKTNNQGGKVLEVFSMIDNKLFTFRYWSTVENFDRGLVLAEKILNTIKITS